MYRLFRPISNPDMTGKQQEPSREELVIYLEQISGRRIRTREDIKSVRRWQKVKDLTLVALAAFAFVQYYALDVMAQIMALRENTYFVPTDAPMTKSKS